MSGSSQWFRVYRVTVYGHASLRLRSSEQELARRRAAFEEEVAAKEKLRQVGTQHDFMVRSQFFGERFI